MAEPISAWLAQTAFVQAIGTALAVEATTVAIAMTYAAMVVTGMDLHSQRARSAACASRRGRAPA